jgi:hypothetical protein
VFPVRYELDSYVLFRKNSVFKALKPKMDLRGIGYACVGWMCIEIYGSPLWTLCWAGGLIEVGKFLTS